MLVMQNLRMQEKLEKWQALDVSKCEKTPEGDYILDGELKAKAEDPGADTDFCDASTEQWVWSIGKRKSDGVVLASTNSKFYQNDLYECLFLR